MAGANPLVDGLPAVSEAAAAGAAPATGRWARPAGWRVAAGVAGIAAILVLALAPGCGSKGNAVNPADRVCGGKYDLGARVTGTGSPFDICISDKDASVTFQSNGRYFIDAQTVIGNTTYNLQMEFPYKATLPAVLNLTANPAGAAGDPDGCFFYYAETPAGGTTLETYEITGGTFTLTFSDGTVVAATFDGVTVKLRNHTSGTDAGTRTLDQGFLSLTVDS